MVHRVQPGGLLYEAVSKRLRYNPAGLGSRGNSKLR